MIGVMAKRDDGEEFVDVRIPAALADRIDRVFAECRGYEAASMQESLSVLCDVAAGRLDAPTDAAVARGPDTSGPGDSPAAESRRESSLRSGDVDALAEMDETRRANVDAAFPARWSSDPEVASRLAAVVDRYVTNPEGLADEDAREADALHAVGDRDGLAPDELRDELVTALYGNTGLPDDLAGEFFSDGLATVANAETDGDADDEPVTALRRATKLDDSPIYGTGPPAVTDGPPATPAQPASDVDPETAFDSPTDEVTVDSLLADEAAPTARCEHCEAYHPVDDLETVIGSASATIELLCGSCAAAVEENS
jgi:hypothetical protein